MQGLVHVKRVTLEVGVLGRVASTSGILAGVLTVLLAACYLCRNMG